MLAPYSVLSFHSQPVEADLGHLSADRQVLIKRVYEIDPLECPRCHGQMKVVAFIEPPQGAVIEEILRHCGLWQSSTPRAPPAVDDWVHDPDRDSDSQTARSDAPLGITYVDIDTFEATF